jgi:1-deoxy-D-xylulose-5-phosphate reductoisomerase
MNSRSEPETNKGVRGICVLGATGSIGRSTLDVIARHPDRFKAVALTANSQVAELAQLAAECGAEYVAIADASKEAKLHREIRVRGLSTQVLGGPDGVAEVTRLAQVHTVMAAIVGSAGLRPTLEAAKNGKRILLANKEALVMAGPIFMETVRSNKVELLPIDSEHNAIFQCLPENGRLANAGVRRVLLTASGGPFRKRSRLDLLGVTPDEACAHPTWTMGRKISVDSATMMNKGLEIIEAHWLFDVPKSSIDVVIHPQSVIHSMVEYVDGSVIAQMGNPDMRTPIAQAMAFPERIDAGVRSLDLTEIGQLTFERPDHDQFPALRLAYQALQMGGGSPAVLNAANEIAVDAFLKGALSFLDISVVTEKTLEHCPGGRVSHLDDVMAIDEAARRVASEQVAKCGGRAS